MIKKIKISDLRVGMFIHDFNCRWIDHPFFKSNIKVSDDDMLRKVMNAGISELYIDTDNGLDVAGITSREEESRSISPAPKKNDTAVSENKVVSVKSELRRAVNIKNEAREIIKNVMHDIKFGEQIRTI